MKPRDRFHAVMNFEPVDRLPVIEWAPYWLETLDRWRRDDLPAELAAILKGLDSDRMQTCFEIRDYLGLDPLQEYWGSARGPETPGPKAHGAGLIANADDYNKLRPLLCPEQPPDFNERVFKEWAAQQQAGDLVVWIDLEGFFFWPREVVGIERHLYAFYDQPELMHEINRDLLAYTLRVIDQFCEICVPDFVVFGEDFCYNHGPMVSREHFEDIVAPYYRQVIPRLEERGIISFVDCDGDVTDVVPWILDMGVRGLWPFERAAGVDVNQIRQDYPDLLMIGGYDKLVMHKGEQAIRKEFERLLPAMCAGGYIPSVDHQVPPNVSLPDYLIYVRLLKEYACKAAQGA